MMSERNLQGLFSTCLDGLRDMVDVNTIVGDAITTPDGTMVIPISKVSFGFGVGGGDSNPQSTGNQTSVFGGGSGGGVTINPIGFLVIANGEVSMLSVDCASPLDSVVQNIPAIVDAVKALFRKKESCQKDD